MKLKDKSALVTGAASAMADARGVKLPPKLKVYDGGSGAGKS
jgi:hypothetical protein